MELACCAKNRKELTWHRCGDYPTSSLLLRQVSNTECMLVYWAAHSLLDCQTIQLLQRPEAVNRCAWMHLKGG